MITSSTPKKSTQSFTLIELLVSISIIVILLTMLLPSLRNAREVVKSTVCLKNLKNIGIADMLYVRDNNYWYNPNQPIAHEDMRWSKNADYRKYTGWDKVSPEWMIPNELACPVSIEKCRKEGVDYTTDAVKDLRTYGPFAIYGNKTYRGLNANWIVDSSQLGRAGDLWGGWQFSQNDYDPRHQNKVNINYYDGHAVTVSNSAVASAYNIKDPWVDSDGSSLSNINDSRH